MKLNDSKGSGCIAPFMLVWLTGWTAGTLAFDGIAVWGLAKQLSTLRFDEAAGVVTKSKVEVDHDSEGTSYRLDVEYSYEVDGVGFTNDRISYGMAWNGENEVERMAKRYAVDTRIAVYHDSADPQDSVLIRGISAMDLFLPLFLIPFNIVMIGVFSFTVGSRVRGWFCKRPVTIRIRQRDVIWHVKVYKFLPIGAAGIAALATSFVSVFVVGFGQMILPGWWLIIPAWCVVILATLYAYFKCKPVVRLAVDPFHGRLTVQTRTAVGSETIDFARIRSIDVRGESVVLGANPEAIHLSCSGKDAADWLCGWLREKWPGRQPA